MCIWLAMLCTTESCTASNVFEFSVVTLGPEVRLILCLDELNSDAYAVRPATNTALDKVVRVQLSTDLLAQSDCCLCTLQQNCGLPQ